MLRRASAALRPSPIANHNNNNNNMDNNSNEDVDDFESQQSDNSDDDNTNIINNNNNNNHSSGSSDEESDDDNEQQLNDRNNNNNNNDSSDDDEEEEEEDVKSRHSSWSPYESPESHLWDDKDDLLQRFMDDPLELAFASDALRADPDVVLQAVAGLGAAFGHAADSLKANRGFVLMAIHTDPICLLFADDKFRYDRELVLATVRRDGKLLLELPPEWCDDKEIALEACRDYQMLRSKCNKFQEDPLFSLDALMHNRLASEDGRVIPICNVDHIEKLGGNDGWKVLVHLLSGEEYSVQLPAKSTLAHLSHQLAYHRLPPALVEGHKLVRILQGERCFTIKDGALPLDALLIAEAMANDECASPSAMARTPTTATPPTTPETEANSTEAAPSGGEGLEKRGREILRNGPTWTVEDGLGKEETAEERATKKAR